MLDRFQPQAYALLRIVAGAFFVMHGSKKLFGWPADGSPAGGPLPLLILTAGVIEVVAGLMIASGFFTRAAAFLASGTMAVAFFKAHFPGGWNPVLNGGELAAVYAFLFLFVATRGPGVWSVDALRTNGKSGLAPEEKELLAA